MKEKINIAELLKDCPKGMELDCTMFDNVVFEKLDVRSSHHPIIIRRTGSNDSYYTTAHLNKYGQYGDEEDCKCVIFPKGKTTWEGFHRPFKDGDILVHTQNQRLITSIYHNRVTELIIGTHCILWDKNDGLTVNAQICCYPDDTRFATEEEKEKLFQAIKDNGYKWNPENKTLEKLPKFKVGDRVKKNKDYISGIVTDIFDDSFKVTYDGGGCSYVQFNYQDDWELVPNKFDVTTLKPFDKVLVRDNVKHRWRAGFYRVGCASNYTIPYEENQHLLGTTNDCDEFYKNW